MKFILQKKNFKDLTSKFIMTMNYLKGKNFKNLLPTVKNGITFWKCQNNCAIVSWGQYSVQLSSAPLFLSTNTGHPLSCQHLVITNAWETNFITYWWWKCKSSNVFLKLTMCNSEYYLIFPECQCIPILSTKRIF